MSQLKSPAGTLIVGTLEQLTGWAGIMEDVTQNPDGTFNFSYDGETRIEWDNQETVRRDGERIFIDDCGGEFKESQLTLVESIPDVCLACGTSHPDVAHCPKPAEDL